MSLKAQSRYDSADYRIVPTLIFVNIMRDSLAMGCGGPIHCPEKQGNGFDMQAGSGQMN